MYTSIFILYINDLPSYLEPAQSVLYADDVSIILKSNSQPNAEIESKAALFKLEKWLSANMLILNKEKTKEIPFRTTKGGSLKVKDHNIESVNDIRVLGVVIDSDLSWRPHLECLKNKLNSAIFVLRNLKATLDSTALKSVYFALFHSLLAYGIIFWGNSSGVLEVFRLQKWALRVMIGESIRTSCRSHFKGLGILPLPSLYILETICFIKKHIHEFNTGETYHQYPTRYRNNLREDAHQSTMYERGVRSSGIRMYNLLPTPIKQTTGKKFRVLLKKELLSICAYTVEEYRDYYKPKDGGLRGRID